MQHGFRKSRSCESQLIFTIQDLAKGIDDNTQNDTVLLDFTKAFDKVPHKRLASKLHQYGIHGPTLSWIKSFLANGCSSVILLHPKMGVEPDVISMPAQQYTNTNYISLERYHLVVSSMLRYIDQIKTFNDNLSCREVIIDKIFGMTYRTLLSNATGFYKYSDNKRSVHTKHIS